MQTKKTKKLGKKPAHSNSTIDQNNDDVTVSVDDLDWKGVPLPDRFEDAGGFLGLEEIDGVDVVRPEGKGDIQFKVS